MLPKNKMEKDVLTIQFKQSFEEVNCYHSKLKRIKNKVLREKLEVILIIHTFAVVLIDTQCIRKHGSVV